MGCKMAKNGPKTGPTWGVKRAKNGPKTGQNWV